MKYDQFIDYYNIQCHVSLWNSSLQLEMLFYLKLDFDYRPAAIDIAVTTAIINAVITAVIAVAISAIIIAIIAAVIAAVIIAG